MKPTFKAIIMVLVSILLILAPTSCQMPNHLQPNQSASGTLEIAWQRSFADILLDWIADDNNMVYILERSGKLTALSLMNGEENWQIYTSGNSSLNLTGNTIIVDNWDADTITGVDRSDGRALWSTFLPDCNDNGKGIQIVPGNEKVFVGCQRKIYALDIADGHLLWEYPLYGGELDLTYRSARGYSRHPFVSMTYDGDNLYVRLAFYSLEVECVQLEGDVRALNAQTGEEKWRFAFFFFPTPGEEPETVATPLLVGNRYIFFVSYDGVSYFVDRATGHGDMRLVNYRVSRSTGPSLYSHDGIVAMGDYVSVWLDDEAEIYRAWSNVQPPSPGDLLLAEPDPTDLSLVIPGRGYQALAVQPGEHPTLWRATVRDDRQGFTITATDVLSGEITAQYTVHTSGEMVERDLSHSYMVFANERLVLAQDQYTLVAVTLSEGPQ